MLTRATQPSPWPHPLPLHLPTAKRVLSPANARFVGLVMGIGRVFVNLPSGDSTTTLPKPLRVTYRLPSLSVRMPSVSTTVSSPVKV